MMDYLYWVWLGTLADRRKRKPRKRKPNMKIS